MKFQRQTVRVTDALRPRGQTLALRADEVSRHAVRLVVVDRAANAVRVVPFATLPELLRAGDLVIVNDAATLPASLFGTTARGERFELRLSAPIAGSRLYGVVLGEGDYHTRTEDRPPPPRIVVGERVRIGMIASPALPGEAAAPNGATVTIASRALPGEAAAPNGAAGTIASPALPGEAAAPNGAPVTIASRALPGEAAAPNGAAGTIDAVVEGLAGRRVTLVAALPYDELWQAIYAAGVPIQYAHRCAPLPLYAVQTAYASRPWAVEMPSAGRALTWDVLLGLRRAGVQLATLTHAAGLSSTGDDALDRALPWPERYELPQATLDAIRSARERGGRVIAIGTTVVRALESAALEAETREAPLDLAAGSGIATLRLDPAYRPRVVDGLVSGLHVPGESHFELLSAFAPRALLVKAIALAAEHGMSGHELGDACLVLEGR